MLAASEQIEMNEILSRPSWSSEVTGEKGKTCNNNNNNKNFNAAKSSHKQGQSEHRQGLN